MNIVIFAHFAGSPRHGMVYGHYHLARQWIRLGHRVTILAAGYAHTRFRQPEVRCHIVRESIDGINYVWIPTLRYAPDGRIGRVLNILSFVAGCCLAKLPIQTADVVICSSHYPLAIYPARRAARRFNAALVFEVRDLWPLTLVELGGASTQNPFIRAMQSAEDYAYRNSDLVVSVLEHACDYMVARGMSKNKFLYIPNGIDIELSGSRQRPLPPKHIASIERFKNSGRFIVGYAGRIGLSNALHALIGAVARCDDPKVGAAVLGDGSYLNEIKQLTLQLKLQDQILFLQPVLQSQVADFLSRIDAAFIGVQNKPLFRHGISPTKLNEYLLAAKPVIMSASPDRVPHEPQEAIINCQAENQEEIAGAITRLKNAGPEERRKMGDRGRSWVVARRDYRVLAERFLDGVRQVKEQGRLDRSTV